MPTYSFRCAGPCGPTQERHPMQAIPSEIACPVCSRTARRVFTAPALGRADPQAMRLHDATRATADAPAVVGSLPSAGATRPVSTNPLHRKLPKP